MSTNANLAALVASALARDQHIPLFRLQDGATVSRGDLLARSNAIAGALRYAGVAPGDRVMVQAEKSVAAVALYLATHRRDRRSHPIERGDRSLLSGC